MRLNLLKYTYCQTGKTIKDVFVTAYNQKVILNYNNTIHKLHSKDYKQ